MIKDRQQSGISCKDCKFSQLCIAKQFSDEDKQRMDKFILKVKIINKGEHVYRDNDVDYIYAVQSGTLKDYYVDKNGQEYINNFYFVGDLLALEALSQKQYSFSAVALSKTILCMIRVVSLLTEMQFFPA